MTEGKGSMSKNPQKITEKFQSYLEKHRIVELFQELSTMLLIKKPDDHVLFLKQSLCHAARRLDVPRIIILAPSEVDKHQLAKILRNKLNIPIISLNDIVDDSMIEADSNLIVDKLRIIVMDHMKNNCDGWIFTNFPRTETDARCLQRSGIIPTHVIDIISSNAKFVSTMPVTNISDINYYKEIQGLRRTFSAFLMKIFAGRKKCEEIAEECLYLVKRRNYFQARTKYRILLIDYQDSMRSSCLGEYIAKIFNLTHINFCEVLEKICLCDTDLGDEIRKVKEKKNLKNLCSKMKIQVFEHFLLKSHNLKNNGWILTGFFMTIDDFKNIDIINTPPNRVLLIISQNYTSNVEINKKMDSNCLSKKESKESLCDCEEERIPLSDETIKDIIDYAGDSVNIIKEDSDLNVMKEKIELILMSPRPCVPPRIPQEPSSIKFKDIEFDPDDEPCTKVFDGIREFEQDLQLI